MTQLIRAYGTFDTVGAFQSAYLDAVKTAIQSLVKTLLEQKHLYQSVDIDPSRVSEPLLARTHPAVKDTATRLSPNVAYWGIFVDETAPTLTEAVSAFTNKGANNLSIRVQWSAPDLKLFCEVCGRLEPYNRVTSTNMLTRLDSAAPGVLHGGKLHQVFGLTYLCQSCKSVPEVFLIRRKGLKLTLCGRAPMEHAPVPKCIPKEIKSYYSGAVVAHQAGQTLSALFMQRTACEQWARLYADPSDKADAALDKYAATLPSDFRDRFPSLKDVYSRLSAAIHKADPNVELYESTLDELEQHFDARRLYRIPDRGAS